MFASQERNPCILEVTDATLGNEKTAHTESKILGRLASGLTASLQGLVNTLSVPGGLLVRSYQYRTVLYCHCQRHENNIC